MDSDSACGLGPAALSSSAVEPRAVTASPRRAIPYASLRGSSDIRRVRRAGNRRRVGGVTCFAATGETGPPRVAFIASRSVGSAVQRNRAKRRLRQAVRRAQIEEGRDYVVVADPDVATVPFGTLVEWVSKAMEQE